MGGIGQIIGGALQGYGEGLEKQETAAQLQYQRDMALEQLRATNQSASAVQQSQLTDERDASHQAREFAYGTSKEAQKQTYEQSNIRLKGSIDLSNDKQLEAVKQRYKLTDIQAQSMADIQKDVAVAGQTVDHWAVTTDGKMVAFNKQGGVLRYSENPGSFIPSGESQNGSDTGVGIGGATGGSIAGERSARGSTPAPAAQQKPTAQKGSSAAPAQPANTKAAALAQAGNVYAAASQNPAAYRSKYPGMFDAQGNLLPRDEVVARIEQAYAGR
jgi:hypothetical protein